MILGMLCLKIGDLFNICAQQNIDLFRTKSGLQTPSGTNIEHKIWACGFMEAVKKLWKKEKLNQSTSRYYKALYPLACRVRQEFIENKEKEDKYATIETSI